MAEFSYRAVDLQGRLVTGRIEAASLLDLEQRCAGQGLTLLKAARAWLPAFGQKRITRKDLASLCLYLEQLSRAGVPVLDGLTELRDGLDNPRLRAIISDVIDKVGSGLQLSDAFAAYPEVFDRVFIALLRAGEQTGDMATVLAQLAANLKWHDELAARAGKIITYPAILAVVIAAVFGFLMVYLVPQLVSFLQNQGKALPWQTRALIASSQFVQQYGLMVLAATAVAVMLMMALLRQRPEARLAADRLMLRLPLIGPVLHKAMMARFASVFGMLFGAGIHVLAALKTCEGVIGNRHLAGAIEQALVQIEQGQSLAKAFEQTGLFAPLVLRMLALGESTGGLQTAMANVRYFYERDVHESIDRVQALIEPALTVIMGLLVGWLIMSVLTPIYDTLSSLKL